MGLNAPITLNTGRTMPNIGLGTWQLTINTPEVIQVAIKNGYRMIDTSGDYGTQPGIAKGLKMCGIPRDDIFIVTKVEENEDAYRATQENLEELQCDYADLMLIHRPPKDGAGEELWKGLIQAKKDGLTRDIGISNYSTGQIDKLIKATDVVPAVNQIEWSPFGYSEDMQDYCHAKGIVIMAYSPLTRGQRLRDVGLVNLADKYGVTPAQILIRWNIQNGTVPIPKANKLVHLKENINVFDFELSEDDMETLFNLNDQYSSLGKLQYVS